MRPTLTHNMKQRITDNLARIRDNIADACARSRRSPESVRLIAVTKTVEIDAIRVLLDLGQLDLGESRVQELTHRHAMIQETLARRRELGGAAAEEPAAPRWHMVGHLQRNKVKPLLPIVEVVHSVDSLRLAEEINTNAARLGLAEKVSIMLQVNTSEEKQKFGLAVGAVAALAEQVETLPNLRIIGLMTMAALEDNAEKSRFCFARLREIQDELTGERIVGPDCRHLSMGMSRDYAVAVEEGATMVRIGTALFD